MKIHIGEKIKEIFEARGMKISEFANRINTVRQNVYKIFKKNDINTELLLKISRVLEYDFFRHYISENLAFNPSDNFNERRKLEMEMEIGALSKQVEALTKEVEYLKKINVLLEEKANYKEGS